MGMAEEARTADIRIRVKPSEKARWQEAAGASDRSLSNWLSRTANEAAKAQLAGRKKPRE